MAVAWSSCIRQYCDSGLFGFLMGTVPKHTAAVKRWCLSELGLVLSMASPDAHPVEPMSSCDLRIELVYATDDLYDHLE